MLIYLLVVFFRTDSVSTLGGSSRAVQSVSLGQSLSVQEIILIRLAVLLISRGSSHFFSPFHGIHAH